MQAAHVSLGYVALPAHLISNTHMLPSVNARPRGRALSLCHACARARACVHTASVGCLHTLTQLVGAMHIHLLQHVFVLGRCPPHPSHFHPAHSLHPLTPCCQAPHKASTRARMRARTRELACLCVVVLLLCTHPHGLWAASGPTTHDRLCIVALVCMTLRARVRGQRRPCMRAPACSPMQQRESVPA